MSFLLGFLHDTLTRHKITTQKYTKNPYTFQPHGHSGLQVDPRSSPVVPGGLPADCSLLTPQSLLRGQQRPGCTANIHSTW